VAERYSISPWSARPRAPQRVHQAGSSAPAPVAAAAPHRRRALASARRAAFVARGPRPNAAGAYTN